MDASQKWGDLTLRLTSGALLIVVGLGGVWLGGHVFHGLIALIAGLMVWELTRMLGGTTARRLAALASVVLLGASYLPPAMAVPLLIAPALVGCGQLRRGRKAFLFFTLAILLAGYGMIKMRDDLGLLWMLWLVAVVVVTDVAGYFAGRMLGGPKFWPAISPKKTWSGTVAGWIAAGIVGAIFAGLTQAGMPLVVISVAASLASQMGDIAESAVKRRVGVKDSSTLIPGHGGLLDRFDGMLGASLMLVGMGLFVTFPPGSAP